jgi:hypothetical protein
MSLATVFAYLLATGLCAQTEFRASDGSRLVVMVCPRSIAAEQAPEPGQPGPQQTPRPEKRT